MIKWYLLVAASSFIAGVWFGLYKFKSYVDYLEGVVDNVEKEVRNEMFSVVDKTVAFLLRIKDKA